MCIHWQPQYNSKYSYLYIRITAAAPAADSVIDSAANS